MDEARVDRVERKLGRLKEAKSKPATAVVRETAEEEEVDNVERSEERLSASSSSSSSIVYNQTMPFTMPIVQQCQMCALFLPPTTSLCQDQKWHCMDCINGIVRIIGIV